jgi:type II secretory pathway pseudopilin PulG
MKHNSSAGFSYIDVMIAIVILSVGILGLMSGLAGAVVQSKGQETQLLAKQVAASTMESIMSQKETDADELGWITVGNVGKNLDVNGVPRGIFVNGEKGVHENAGPDEVMGTADDSGALVPYITREIVITDICDPDRPSYNCPTPGPFEVRMRRVTITMRYYVGTMKREETLRTIVTDYAQAD